MLTNQPQPFYIKKLPGMNNKQETLELRENYVEVAQNCRFEDQPGAVVKRQPITYFNTTPVDTLPIVGLYRYYKSDGTTKFVTVSDDTVYVGDDATGTFSAIRTSLTTGKRMCFLTYKDILLGSNGYDDIFCYDGSTDNITWELGSCKAKATTSAGSVTKSNISYQVTMDNDAYVCGAVSNTITSVSSKNIELTNIPLGPIGTVNRKIYRKDNETGADYKYLTVISNNTGTTYTDSTASVNGNGVLPAITDDMPKGAELQLIRERLFITRDPSKLNRIYFSNPYTPGYIQQTTNLDYLDISPDDNDEIMGIPMVLGVVLCFKKNTVRKLYVTGPQANWYAEDPFTFTGTPAPWSITQTPYGVAYLGWDHWYMYTGAGTEGIMDEFDTYEILPASYADTIGFWDSTELLAAYTDISGGSQVHDRVMRYNFKRKALSYDTIKVNCFAAKRGDAETGELYYGSSQTGYVYKSVNEDIAYRLSTKTDCNAGTKTDVYVGGTESSPYIEIGSVASAVEIPDDICILWDNKDNNPGSGWTEITDKGDRFIYIDNVNAVGTTSDAVGISGLTITNFTSIKFRIFKKNSTTTEYEFPDGAIVFYDQGDAPTGYEMLNLDGKYVTINTIGSDVTGQPSSPLGESYIFTVSGVTTAPEVGTTYTNNSITFTVTYQNLVSGAGSIIATASGAPAASGTLVKVLGVGDVNITFSSGVLQTGTTQNIENTLKMVLIKKIGEADTWDGTSKYVYALLYAASTTSPWIDVTSTYTNKYVKGKTSSGGPETTDGADVKAIIDWIPYATHESTGGGVEALGYDGDFTTAQSKASSGGNTITATHTFAEAISLSQIKYRLKSHGYAYGDSSASVSLSYKIEYTTNGVDWIVIDSASA